MPPRRMMPFDFGSDNRAAVHPAVMDAMVRANIGPAAAYGEDDLSIALERRIADLFEHPCAVFPVTTGSAANGLALSLLTPPWGLIAAHATAHIQTDECGLPELYTAGAKILPIAGDAGHLSPDGVAAALADFGHGPPHAPPPSALSITQSTECGTVYAVDQVAALSELAHTRGMGVHMDGARFANALVSTGVSPAELSWKAGVDVLSLGGTKNGAMAAEMVIVFDPARAQELAYRRKRSGQLWSKHRFLAAQWLALLDDDLWLQNATHANAMAQRLARGLAPVPGVSLPWPVQANALFPILPEGLADRLIASGASFYPWGRTGASMYRLVTSWATTPDEVDGFLALASQAAPR